MLIGNTNTVFLSDPALQMLLFYSLILQGNDIKKLISMMTL